MQSTVIKRSIVVSGHKTSVSLEDAFWEALKKIAAGRGATLTQLVASIDARRAHANLSSAIRLFVLDFYREQLEAQMALGNGSLDPAAGRDHMAPASDIGSRGRSCA